MEHTLTNIEVRCVCLLQVHVELPRDTLSPGKGQTGEIILNVTCTKSVKSDGGEVPPRPAYTEPGERDRTGPGIEGSSLYRAEVIRKVTRSQPLDFIIKVRCLDLTRAKLLPRWLPK